MVWLRQHGHFSCAGILEACLYTVTTIMFGLAIAFNVDHEYCGPTLVQSTVCGDSYIQCNKEASLHRSNAMWTVFVVLLFVDILLVGMFNWGRPYNVFFVGKPVKHCKNCQCEEHIHPTEGQRLNYSSRG